MSTTSLELPTITAMPERLGSERLLLNCPTKIRRFARHAVASWERAEMPFSGLLDESEHHLPNILKAQALSRTLEKMGCKPGVLDMSGVIYSPLDTKDYVGYVIAEKYQTLVAAGSDSPELDEEELGHIAASLPDVTIIHAADTAITVHNLSGAHIEEFAPSSRLRAMVETTFSDRAVAA